jgi:hypothetical protein
VQALERIPEWLIILDVSQLSVVEVVFERAGI